ncbi:hypothetical protein OSH11_00205 [Kaistia dalseonensis]|uniref:Uncharacterized protein n=1 Tax=Kaistia dalseonensis TaxID=410840 RepID=A0ABU0H0W9_9HYPH|nr:hypothetical protein [Kaistia dalseonensis]MCX5493117.1 hypothetical protein [Kaistia dalseonensis]MDQ0435672.1 hypothetical protein [Kaistia dalseonensis]
MSPDAFAVWRDNDVRCSAGKREFQLGRYMVEHVRNGYQFSDALERFRHEAEAHRKTGFLAIVPSVAEDFPDSLSELRRLGEIMVDAGLADSAGALINGGTVAVPFELPCPVTGMMAIYEFFPVAFCRHAAVVADPLYDPSLSSPFLAINTTSDAFAFGMLVKDLCERHFHCEPYEVQNRHDLERLLQKCAAAWQNMSINTITGYNKIAARPERAVHLAEDRKSWLAPHNDPVFAETVKEMHSHEMPVVYAERLCQKWLSALFDGASYRPGRDGQSGGSFVDFRDIAGALRL